MKNNRKIEVGQVRMYTYHEDGSCWENSMYHILKIDGDYVDIKFLTGESKGEVTCWRREILEDDVVVM